MAEVSQAAVAGSPPVGGSAGAGAARRALKRLTLGLALTTGLVGAAVYGYRYWTVGQYLVSTDDAYIQADYTTTAPKVSGYIAEVLVEDNQHVTAGQVLARIDDRDFKTAAGIDRSSCPLFIAARRAYRMQLLPVVNAASGRRRMSGQPWPPGTALPAIRASVQHIPRNWR